MKQFADDVLDKKRPYTKTVCGLFLTPTSYDVEIKRCLGRILQ